MGKWCSQVGALWGPQWEYEVPTLSLEVFNAHMDGVLGAVVYASGQCWVNGLDWMVLGFFSSIMIPWFQVGCHSGEQEHLAQKYVLFFGATKPSAGGRRLCPSLISDVRRQQGVQKVSFPQVSSAPTTGDQGHPLNLSSGARIREFSAVQGCSSGGGRTWI